MNNLKLVVGVNGVGIDIVGKMKEKEDVKLVLVGKGLDKRKERNEIDYINMDKEVVIKKGRKKKEVEEKVIELEERIKEVCEVVVVSELGGRLSFELVCELVEKLKDIENVVLAVVLRNDVPDEIRERSEENIKLLERNKLKVVRLDKEVGWDLKERERVNLKLVKEIEKVVISPSL